ncbi:Hypothetical predicted protein, partial [Paramuricea clavata]
MAVKLTPKIRQGRRTSKPRWRCLLLQSEKCTENHFRWVEHQLYRIFITDQDCHEPYKMKPLTEKIKEKCRSGSNVKETGCAIQRRSTKGQAYHREIDDDPCPTEAAKMQ